MLHNKLEMSDRMYNWAKDLYPLNRSLTGEPNRFTLRYLKNFLPNLQIKSFKSGEKVFDWIVPQEYQVDEAYVTDSTGNIVIDFSKNNLHLVGYSTDIDSWMDVNELKKHLHTLPDNPDAIPYLTTYYKKNWGFAISHNDYINLNDSNYHVVIKSKLFDGELNYGELILQGSINDEILLSTYICHPSMGNNEISGIVVTAALAQQLSELSYRRYTYRILFIPETIGSIAYLNSNWQKMKERTKAGFVVTCVGDTRCYSFMPSRTGETYADKIARFTLDKYIKTYKSYSFLQRGSDERQYCSPLIDLPVVSIMRSKYGEYPEYHTSLDNLDLISSEGLGGSYNIIKTALDIIEKNRIYIPLYFCEPQLGKRGLYNITNKDNPDSILNILAYLDGRNDLVDICNIIDIDFFECQKIVDVLLENNLIIEKTK